MVDSLFPRKNDDPGYIVAWRSKLEHKAGRYLDQVMTYGEAKKRATALAAQSSDKTFWAERPPAPVVPH
ncbi:MAG: hypothetical protein B7Z66_07870 [Chromatiales bacterium 21-64-14]|nr:MAG: hypothetical protein B7Z66_07870 [Chromatiales bacterium 21-64-14]HQU15972.1 hypothetical protein [Gammaproteobacteria bacterium]